MSISGRCRFVVGTIDGKCVSYILDQPAQPSQVDRPLTSNCNAPKPHSQNRPSTTAAETEDPNEARGTGAVTLSNHQLDELMEILQRHQVGEQQQNRQAWSEDEGSLTNERYLRECQSAVHEEPTKDYDDSRDSGYYGTTCSAMKPSLIELKKQQWAREKAEMQGLLYPWGRPQSEKHGNNEVNYDNLSNRPSTTKSTHVPQNTTENGFDHYDGYYQTDISINHTPASRYSRSPANHDTKRHNGSHDEGRLKWGDRGVAVGHLWEPSTSPSRLPEQQHTNPAWLEKSLGPDGDAANVIYGRKVYIEPADMEEREAKRKKALENQKAIREQLEERDRRRREERERRALEEKEEEERIRKESELIKQRYKQEKRKEQKMAKEEEEEIMQKQAPPKNKNSQGWNKKEISPRARHRQRRQSETTTKMQKRKNNIIQTHEPEILTLHHSEDDYSLREDYGSKSVFLPGGEDEMILLGKEVAVLLAPELERRILMSRSGRDVATQTDITQGYLKRSNKAAPVQTSSKEKPIWGANRTNKKYIKQSDKDVYRQRGVSLNSRSKFTTDSTDDTDKYPRSSPQLDRRKRAQSLGKGNYSGYNGIRSSEEDGYSSYGARKTRKDTWQEKNKVPQPLSWSVDLRESQPPTMPPVLPRRATNSPPVPAVLSKKNGHQRDERRFTPSPVLKYPATCPPSPPVPAVLRQLQEQSLPRLVNAEGEINMNIGTQEFKELPLEIEQEPKLALPDIKPNLMALPTESSDLLSQLTSIRKNLQNKQLELQALADEG